MNRKELTKTDQGYDYRGVSIIRDSSGFHYRILLPFGSVGSIPTTLKKCVEKIDQELAQYSVERFKINKKG
jgi:hypothetical protein